MFKKAWTEKKTNASANENVNHMNVVKALRRPGEREQSGIRAERKTLFRDIFQNLIKL